MHIEDDILNVSPIREKPGEGFILPLHLSYICFCIYMSVYLKTLSILLGFCMLQNLIVRYNSFCYFAIYLSYSWVILPLYHFYRCVCIDIFVNVLPMVTEICLGTSYNKLFGCSTYLESCHTYFLYNNLLLHCRRPRWLALTKCINILLFELVLTYIETHIFVPIFSISHIFIFIAIFYIVSHYS